MSWETHGISVLHRIDRLEDNEAKQTKINERTTQSIHDLAQKITKHEAKWGMLGFVAGGVFMLLLKQLFGG